MGEGKTLSPKMEIGPGKDPIGKCTDDSFADLYVLATLPQSRFCIHGPQPEKNRFYDSSLHCTHTELCAMKFRREKEPQMWDSWHPAPAITLSLSALPGYILLFFRARLASSRSCGTILFLARVLSL